MAFTLPELPYAKDALAPHISAETLEFHHGKHHAAYVTNLNNLIGGTEFENPDDSLDELRKITVTRRRFRGGGGHTTTWSCSPKTTSGTRIWCGWSARAISRASTTSRGFPGTCLPSTVRV